LGHPPDATSRRHPGLLRRSSALGDRNRASISADLTVITVTGVILPTANGGLSGAILRIVGATGAVHYRTIASNTATTITVTDPWGVGEIEAGTQLYVVGIVGLDVRRVLVRIADANTPGVVIEPTGSSSQLVEGATSGFGATATYTVRLTMAPGPIQIRLSRWRPRRST
jgi:hypothetical protein